MTFIFSINEMTLIRFLWLSLTRRKVYVLSIDPWVPYLRRVFQLATDWAIFSGRAKDVMELCPEHRHLRERFINIALYNIFGKIECWQNDFFEFGNVDSTIPDYAIAFKKVVCNYIRPKQLDILVLKTVLPKFLSKEVRLLGVCPSVLGATEVYAKRSFQDLARPMPVGLFPISNMIFSCLGLIYCVGWILIRLRIVAKKETSFFLAADNIQDPRDKIIYKELADGGNILLVNRPNLTSPMNEEASKLYPTCQSEDGYFTIMGAIGALKFAILDTYKLLYTFYRQEPGVFYQIAIMPYRRAVCRAFFTRYRPKFYWSRDEYNVEHIFRRQELNRVGGKTFGITHGVAAEKNIMSAWRYVDLDYYYVFGKIFYDLYKDTWPKDMAVSVVGSFSATRDDYAFINKPRPKDIVVFTGIMTLEPSLVKAVRELAKGFPNKKIWLQVKPPYYKLQRGKDFVEACTRDIPNIIHTEDKVFDIIRRVSYAFSDPSTVVIEALQFGLPAFMFDICDFHDQCIYRKFPGICVSSADEAIERIKKLEAGTWNYPREKYTELVDLSGHILFDVIRRDMGLPVTKLDAI